MSPKARYIQISAWNLMVLFGALYLFLVWLGYKYLERSTTLKHANGQVFHPSINQDGFQLYRNECPEVNSPHHSQVSDYSKTKQDIEWKPGMCSEQLMPLKSDIEMERDWSSISVRYPQYVYTVSGWIQVIDVPNYNIKTLRVIIVPHSHHDLGWRDTFESYFASFTKHMFDNMINQLEANPTWKFIWPEISNLEKWFVTAEANRERLKALIRKGQLEIVTGGWVMTDEAVAHYGSMLDQLIEGHLWLHDNLGIVPNTSWSIDPFGHSPTMTYLLKQAGIDKMVIQRTHFAVKRHFAKQQTLEFTWRQAWDSDGKTGVFCHMMPFLLYAIQYSCGPDPHVCCQFDFHTDKCFLGTKSVPKIAVQDSNIRKLSWALWEQYQKKAQLYRSNVVLVPHGDDFRYSSRDEWVDQLGNLGKLIEYMNNDKDMNIKVQFGTLSDYFQALEEDSKNVQLNFPSLTGDFFPYNDRDDQYWTGYYSVRPLFKHMVRVLQSKLRITEILFSLAVAQSVKTASHVYSKHRSVLVDVRRAMGLFQHHDAITGTSKKFVMADYGRILQGAFDRLNTFLALLMLNSVIPDQEKYVDAPNETVYMTDQWTSHASAPTLRASHFDNNGFVIVTNPLTIPWASAITVRTSAPSLVRIKGGPFTPSQTNPEMGQGMRPVPGVYDIVFIAELPALAVKMYELVKDVKLTSLASVTIFGKQLEPTLFMPEFHPTWSNESAIELESHWLKATLSSCKGTLQHTLRKVDKTAHQTEVKMVSYGTGSMMNPFKDKSGAYIFMPDGPAQDIVYADPSIVVIRGPVMSSVISLLPAVRHSTTLYNISGPLGAGVHIDNMVDISAADWDNRELAMRIITNVMSQDTSLCVDLNGYQMHRKKWKQKLLIQGNFHPMTSMAYLTGKKLSRMTLVTSEPHGVTSPDKGVMEVMLDRKLMQDDWRGLNEGPHDNVPSPSKFILLPERRDSPGESFGQSCYPSLLAHLLSSHLNNPPQAAFLANLEEDFNSEARFLKHSWPCPYNLMNIRNLGLGSTDFQALLVLHKVGLDCRFSEAYMDCNVHKVQLLNSFSNVQIQSATETTLTGLREVTLLDSLDTELRDMEIKTIKVSFR